MDNQASILENERAVCQGKEQLAQNEIKQLEENISRLEVAKQCVKHQKNEAKNDLSLFRNYAEQQGTFEQWRGNKANQVYEDYLCRSTSYYDNFIKQIDNAMDTLADEITRLENKVLSLEGDVLYLRRLINSISNELEKLFN